AASRYSSPRLTIRMRVQKNRPQKITLVDSSRFSSEEEVPRLLCTSAGVFLRPLDRAPSESDLHPRAAAWSAGNFAALFAGVTRLRSPRKKHGLSGRGPPSFVHARPASRPMPFNPAAVFGSGP